MKKRPSPSASDPTTAFDGPTETTSGARPPSRKRRYWTPVMTSPRGMKSSPISRKGPRWLTSMRRAEFTIAPHERRLCTLSGADGCHVVRDASQSTRTRATAISTGDGLPTIAVSTVEPDATATQKKSVAVDPSTWPAGTVKLVSRHALSAHVIGCHHCAFVLGPVGPL